MNFSKKDTVAGKAGRASRVGRFLPLAVLIAGFALFFAFDLHEYLTFQTLGRHQDALLGWVEHYGMLAPILFGFIYAVATAFSLPVGLLLTVTGGFLFGPALGTASVVLGATVGATALFIAARTALGSALRARAGPAVERMAKGFEEDAFSYLLVLRLVPLFPFWLVNVAPAFTGIRLRTYVLATVIGIVPGAFVYTLVGNGLGAVLESGQMPDLGLIFEPEILAPIVGLAVLAFVPVVYKRIRHRNH